MRTTIFTIATAFFALAVQAQQVQKESTTTVTTVKDSDGERKLVKTQEQVATQQLQFQDGESKALNKDLASTPTQVMSTTTVTAPDGTTRVVDVDRSAFYTSGSNKYQVRLDNVGYSVMDGSKRSAVLRNLGPNAYIYSAKGKTAHAYFDKNGNMVVSTYDPKTDKITTETYTKN
ncbi:hypothetical protein [Flavobacterium selenitireducens]|uniref:hypothetical protein n=1 Tax=Flavobacterium selenitireducens TaxID=2722704 RepID=UPI00168BDC5A|nr:hypothetical protein [Flavobacterium selenitireducens]MBD3581487.1 hypothetical protein [Flavobacterium selenitireducens]